jgi:hypothetical protein
MLTVLLRDQIIGGVVRFITSVVLPDLVFQQLKTLRTDPVAHLLIQGRSFAYGPLAS